MASCRYRHFKSQIPSVKPRILSCTCGGAVFNIVLVASKRQVDFTSMICLFASSNSALIEFRSSSDKWKCLAISGQIARVRLLRIISCWIFCAIANLCRLLSMSSNRFETSTAVERFPVTAFAESSSSQSFIFFCCSRDKASSFGSGISVPNVSCPIGLV